MTTTDMSNLNLIIPILGIFVLLPLIGAMFFEPIRDYSRRIYTNMLFYCAGTLVLESAQSQLDGASSGNAFIALHVVEFVFFVFLVCLCFSWMLYAYFWFNGFPPSRRLTVWIAVAPALELGALIANFFDGRIYYINSQGFYSRGVNFSSFIVFCYVYMLIVIAATALFAERNKKINNRNLLIFLLFFVFPITGPLVQYCFSDISIMGVSEAIALLVVYVAVQRRAASQYEIERARYQDEYRKYETALEGLLTLSKDALCNFHLNLTRNTRDEARGTSEYIMNLLRGQTVDELFGNIASIISDGDEAVRFREIFNRDQLLHAFGKGDTQIALGYHRKVESGESHWIKTYLNMLRNPGSGDVEAIVYSLDMDRQEKEEKVISAITNREYDYIALINAETQAIHYQYTSEKAVATVHLTMGNYDTVMKKAMAAMLPADELDERYAEISFAKIREELEKQEEYSYLFPYSAASGETLSKKLTYRYLDDIRREILFFRSDITSAARLDRERAEKTLAALREARHANTMKTEFLSNVSHDMRTPLNAVLGYTALAENESDPEKVRIYLEKIDRSGRIMLSLINDTLDLSKIETGIVTLKPAPVRCDEVIDKIIGAVKPAMDEKRIHFTFENSKAVMATINVDALRLQEIVINLLSNAVKFTPENGEVSLIFECEKLEEHYLRDRIIVKDTGCGMSPEFLMRLYEPFAQERQASTANIGGSGLGLSIVKKLVDLMGGEISVKSELGKGTEFTLNMVFERADLTPGQISGVRQASDVLKGTRALLAEDNEMNAEIATLLLETRGVIVTRAENGERACRLFASSEPGFYDLILMDIRMPVMNGYDATKAIRGMNRSDAAAIPIIAMSADAYDDDVKASLDAGMNAHIAKPIDPDAMYEAIRKSL